jgi:hypothetical protein
MEPAGTLTRTPIRINRRNCDHPAPHGVAQNPYVHILGHLADRPTKSTSAPSSTPAPRPATWIELNASPYRFDLDWRLWPTPNP